MSAGEPWTATVAALLAAGATTLGLWFLLQVVYAFVRDDMAEAAMLACFAIFAFLLAIQAFTVGFA